MLLHDICYMIAVPGTVLWQPLFQFPDPQTTMYRNYLDSFYITSPPQAPEILNGIEGGLVTGIFNGVDS